MSKFSLAEGLNSEARLPHILYLLLKSLTEVEGSSSVVSELAQALDSWIVLSTVLTAYAEDGVGVFLVRCIVGGILETDSY